MSLEVLGRLVMKGDTQQVSDKFRKREFVIEITEEVNGQVYHNFGKFQLVQNKCDILDRFREGDELKVSFNIKGNKWEYDGVVNYITNLDAWRIESTGASGQQSGNNQNTSSYAQQNFNPGGTPIDDLPF